MKFYGRIEELKLLSQIEQRSQEISQMTVIIGKRRIGKTRLILKSVENTTFLYFFVSKKNEKLLCDEFVKEIKDKLNVKMFGDFFKFKDIFAFLLETSKTKPFTLIIDEFQEFNFVNKFVYSEIQNIWDINKEQSKMNLILSGSIYSLMKKIFENSKEPLFGRVNERILLKPFNVETLREIISTNQVNFTNKDLLAFYILTGGVAKYVEIFVDKKMLKYEAMLDEIFRSNSYFIDEGKNLLIEEFGREYSTYFSILSLISSSKTARTEIESILEKTIGGYLEKLEKEYAILKKIKPILSKEKSRTIKYTIEDNFLNFWFRFFYKYRSAVEIENFGFLKKIIKRDFDTYSGRFLEKFFVEKLKLSKKYSLIGNYWEKGNKNEIDIIAVNELENKVLFVEVKLNKNKINIEKLKRKSQKLLPKFKNFAIQYKGFSIEDM